jgi:hypothetical protein
MIVNCSNCNKEINRKPNDIKRFKNIYCCQKCRDEAQCTGYKIKCACCGKDIYRSKSAYHKSSSKTFFCNKSCSASYNNTKRKFPNSKSYRIKAFKEKDKLCERCGFNTYESILQVHHKDHNRLNNELNNLEILCPNCHAIEHIEVHGGNNKKPLIID